MAKAELRFVVLRHSGVEEPHFDLMLELREGGDLATWRSAVWPMEGETELTRLKDHRRAYLKYEGLVTGGRGRVDQIDSGVMVVEENDSDLIRVDLDGRVIELRRVRDEEWVGEEKRS